MDNGKDIDNEGKPKTNAWLWFFKEFGAIIAVWILGAPFVIIYLKASIEGLLILGGALLITLFVVVTTPSWYRGLVDNNIIKPFERSKFKEIFKRQNND